jgi:hypothetical protein
MQSMIIYKCSTEHPYLCKRSPLESHARAYAGKADRCCENLIVPRYISRKDYRYHKRLKINSNRHLKTRLSAFQGCVTYKSAPRQDKHQLNLRSRALAEARCMPALTL